MEWVAEGLTLCFIGVLVLLTAFWEEQRIPLHELYSGYQSRCCW